MLTKKEEDELFEVLVEKHEILMPETCCMLRDFLKCADVPQFDYFKLCHTLRFIYGLSAEQSHRILEKTIKDAETCLDAAAKRALFYTLSAFGISAAKISEMLKIPRNTASRWKNAAGRKLVISAAKKSKAKIQKLDSDILAGRRYFAENFLSIMKKAEAAILAKSAKLTPANLGVYLKSCREGRGKIGGFVMRPRGSSIK